MLGPIDYVVIAFPGNQFKGEIIPALQKVTQDGTIRIDDLLFVTKDAQGNVTSLELDAMPAEIVAAFSDVKAEAQELLAETDVTSIGDLLEPNSSAGVLVIEHLWAKDLKQAILNANGVLVAEGRVHPEDVEQAINDKANGTEG